MPLHRSGSSGSDCWFVMGMFNDEVYGPQLRRVMNVFFAENWYERYQYITQCSENHPFVRQIGGGGKIRFIDPQKLINI